MKLVYLSTFAAILLCCGCTTVTGCKSDNKPVAPDTYQDTKSNTADPQLPAQKPWWK